MKKDILYCAVLLFVLCMLILNAPLNDKIEDGSSAPSMESSSLESSSIESSAPSESSEPSPEPGPCTYEVRARMHAGLPEYRFVSWGLRYGTDDWNMGFVMGLKVYDKNNKLMLSKDFSDISDGEVIGYPVYNEMMDTMGLHVVDVNFDGYKDLIILNCFAGAHSNTWYDCWLWDAKTSSLVPSESFSEICNPALDREKKCIYSAGGSGAEYWGGSIYKYIGNQFVETNGLGGDHDNVVETKLLNGKMVTVREASYKNEEEENKEFEYYKNNKLWELDNPRWYMSGGHKADEWLK